MPNLPNGLGDFKNIMPRAKIGLNCHYYGGSPILEIHRIMQMLSHYTLVMSVRSDDKLLDEMFEPFVTFFSFRNYFSSSCCWT